MDALPEGYTDGFGITLDDKTIVVALSVEGGSPVTDAEIRATIFHESLHVMEMRSKGITTAKDYAIHNQSVNSKRYHYHNRWVDKVDRETISTVH